MKFQGTVYFRSSARPGSGPPGEAQVLAENPQRLENILRITGWSRLESGTLNLTVDDAVVDSLLGLKPAWIEDASTVRYPDAYKHIPQIRKAYHYYRASLVAPDVAHAVLVRRAIVPLPRRVELFAPVNLSSALGLAAGDQIIVDVFESV